MYPDSLSRYSPITKPSQCNLVVLLILLNDSKQLQWFEKMLFFSLLQLTVEEATDPEESSDIESKTTSHQSESSTGCKANPNNNSLVTKTYSFRRMISFRGSLRRGRGASSSLEETTCSSPGLHPSQRYFMHFLLQNTV